MLCLYHLQQRIQSSRKILIDNLSIHMATPAKSIPEIPLTTSISTTDEFIVKVINVDKPDKAIWQTMLNQLIAALPPYYF